MLHKAQATVERIQQEIAQEEAILRHMRPQADLERIPARPSRLMDDVPPGYWAQQALDVLRTAESPLTVFEIADEILLRRGMQPSLHVLIRDYGAQKVRSALKRRTGQYCEHDQGRPQRWKLVHE